MRAINYPQLKFASLAALSWGLWRALTLPTILGETDLHIENPYEEGNM